MITVTMERFDIITLITGRGTVCIQILAQQAEAENSVSRRQDRYMSGQMNLKLKKW